jgi:hypothetical protein
MKEYEPYFKKTRILNGVAKSIVTRSNSFVLRDLYYGVLYSEYCNL